MSKLISFFSFLFMLGIFNLLWYYFIFPFLIDGPIDGIYKSVRDSNEGFFIWYICKKIVRYLFWSIITVTWAFFAGPIILKVFDYIVFDQIISALKNFLGIS